MANSIAIYIPSYKGAQFLETVKIPDNCDCVVMDNNSNDNTLEVCQRRGFVLVGNNITVSRTENWLRCLEHFKASNYSWLKWLFVGDELTDCAGQLMLEATKRYASAGVIIYDYYIDLKNKRVLKSWNNHFREGIILNVEAQKSMLEKGPFCTPLCVMVSKHANFDVFEFYNYSWAADMLLLYSLIQTSDIAYVPQPIGHFMTRERKTYTMARKSCISYIESISVGYKIYKQFQCQYPNIPINDSWFKDVMLSALEDNCHNVTDLLKCQIGIFKSVLKLLFRKNNMRSNL